MPAAGRGAFGNGERALLLALRPAPLRAPPPLSDSLSAARPAQSNEGATADSPTVWVLQRSQISRDFRLRCP